MNIGIVSTWFERGAAYVSRAYMETLIKEHYVNIYARGGESNAISDPNWDLPNVTLGKVVDRSYGTYIDWSDFQKWFEGRDLDVIIFNEQKSWDVIIKLQKYRINLGAYIDYYTPQTIPFFSLYDFLLCNTKRHYNVFKNHSQSLYIPWGTDTKLCKPNENIRRDDNVTFFHSAGMGGINFRKGTDLLVRAFQKVTGNARLIIHSQVGLDRLPTLSNYISEDERIEFIVGTYPLPGLYHKGNVYVYPSRLEGIGLSIAEALASGLPVITTDCAPMNEFVIHQFNGMLVKVQDFRIREDDYYWPESNCSIHSLTEAMQFYVNNPNEIVKQSINARTFALQNLSWDTNSANLGTQLKHLKIIRKNERHIISEVKAYEIRERSRAYINSANNELRSGQKKMAYQKIIKALTLNPINVINRRLLRILKASIR